MTIKVKYECGHLTLQENVNLKEGEEYEVELKHFKNDALKTVRAEKLKELTGIVSLGGDAVRDRKELYE